MFCRAVTLLLLLSLGCATTPQQWRIVPPDSVSAR